MTKEEFVRRLESYLTSVEWTDYKRAKIHALLNLYDHSNNTAPKSRKTIDPTTVQLTRRITPNDQRTKAPRDYTVVYKRDAATKRISAELIEAVAAEVCAQFGITLEQLKSPSRKNILTRARRAFYIECIHRYDATYEQLGSFVGRHHSTVLVACNGKPYQRRRGKLILIDKDTDSEKKKTAMRNAAV